MDRFIKLFSTYICSNYIILTAVFLIIDIATCIPDNYTNQKKINRFETWALTPIAKQSLPSLDQTDQIWAKNPIDYFIAAKLNEKRLSPSREANRETLIRRVYFDILGLPPTLDEILEFVNDTNPLAYEQLVERILASPRYGERWARHWLDIVHYGDTHGYDKDKLRPNAWPYRDYVIRSFNSDKPYKRFVNEQIAGDALFPKTCFGVKC